MDLAPRCEMKRSEKKSERPMRSTFFTRRVLRGFTRGEERRRGGGGGGKRRAEEWGEKS